MPTAHIPGGVERLFDQTTWSSRCSTLPAVALLFVVVLVAGCGGGSDKATNAVKPPPPTVVVEAARGEKLSLLLSAVGELRASQMVVLAPRIAGTITQLQVDDGASIAAGTVVAELDVRSAEAGVVEATVLRDDAARLVRESQSLLAKGSETQAHVDALKAALAASEARLTTASVLRDDHRISAPFAGHLGMRQVSLGAQVNAGTAVVTLTALQPLLVLCRIPEIELAKVHQSASISASSPAFPGRRFTGIISAIDPQVDAATRTVLVQATLPNSDEMLRPGQSMDVDISVGEALDAVTVPEEAVLLEATRASVYVVINGQAKCRDVRIGIRRAGRTQIASGLNAGDIVVVRGLQKIIADGMAVSTQTTTETATLAATSNNAVISSDTNSRITPAPPIPVPPAVTATPGKP